MDAWEVRSSLVSRRMSSGCGSQCAPEREDFPGDRCVRKLLLYPAPPQRSQPIDIRSGRHRAPAARRSVRPRLPRGRCGRHRPRSRAARRSRCRPLRLRGPWREARPVPRSSPSAPWCGRAAPGSRAGARFRPPPSRGSGTEPRDPGRDAEPLSQALQLLLRGAGAHDGQAPLAGEIDAGAEEEIESPLGHQPAHEADGQSGVRLSWLAVGRRDTR